MHRQKRRYYDILLLAGWVYSYGVLLWVFRLLLGVESDGAGVSTEAGKAKGA